MTTACSRWTCLMYRIRKFGLLFLLGYTAIAPDLLYDHCIAAGEAALCAGRTLAALHCPCGALHLDDGAFA